MSKRKKTRGKRPRTPWGGGAKRKKKRVVKRRTPSPWGGGAERDKRPVKEKKEKKEWWKAAPPSSMAGPVGLGGGPGVQRERGTPWVGAEAVPWAVPGPALLPTMVRPWEDEATRGIRRLGREFDEARDVMETLGWQAATGVGAQVMETPLARGLVDYPKSSALAQVRRGVGRAGEGFEKAVEAYQLPEAWETAKAQFGAPIEYGSVRAALMRAVEEGGGREAEEALLREVLGEHEAVGEQIEEAGWTLLEAGWHDIKQAPVVKHPARGVEAAAGVAMAGLQGQAALVEEAIAPGAQRLGGGRGLMPLGPSRWLTDEQRAEAAKIAEETAMPEWAAQQGLLLQARQGAPSIRDLAIGEMGEGEQTDRVLRELGLMAYSSYESQREGLGRLIAGEEIDTVITGRKINTWEPSDEEKGAFLAYVEGVRQREGDVAAEAAGQKVVETGLIPGSSDVGNELLFQSGLEPANLLDIGAWSRGMRAAKAAAAGRFVDVVEATKYADDVGDGLQVLMRAGDVAQVAGRGDEAGTLSRLWKKVNPWRPTKGADAELLANAAYQVVTPAVLEIGSADEARAVVRAMAEDPGRMVDALGNVPLSQAADEARPLLAGLVDDLDDAKKFPSLRRTEFEPAAFAADLDGAMIARAREMTGATAAAEKVPEYKKFAQGFKNLMSKFYLRTPGYAARNAEGDLVTMAWDGLLSLDGRGQIDDFLKRFGPTTRRVGGTAAGPQVLARTAAETGLAGAVEKVTGRFGRWIGRQEEGRYTRAFYTRLQQVLPDVWRPSVPAEMAAELGPDLTRMVEAGLAKGVGGDEFVEVVGKSLGEGPGLVDVGQWLDRPDDLSVALRLQLERELADVAGDAAGIDDVIERAAVGVREQAGRMFAGDPTPPGRRQWSDIEALQDLQEDQGILGVLGKRLGVDEAEVARVQDELAEALRPGEVAIRAAEEELAGAVAAGFDENAAQLMRSVRAETSRSKMLARAQGDQWLDEAHKMLDEGAKPDAVWPWYYGQKTPLMVNNQAEVLGRLQEAAEQLKRFQAGESFQAVTGKTAASVTDEVMDLLRSQSRDLAARKGRVQRLGIEEFVDFENMLEARRLTVDMTEMETWRQLAINPSRDGFDIAMSAQEAVDRASQAARTAHERAQLMYRNKQLSQAQYKEVCELIWGGKTGWFPESAQRWRLGLAQLSELPMTPGTQQRALGALGWPVEQAARLGPEELSAVLGAGVKWDPLLDAPMMPIADAMRGTLAEVAGEAGLDLVASADWTPAQWESVRLVAEDLRKKAGARGSAAARMVESAAEVGAEAARAEPQGIAAGMEIVYPASVDDVARFLGLRPQGMGPDEWAEVAAYAESRGRDAALLGDEFGRKSLAAQKAGRMPEERVSTIFGNREVRMRTGRLSLAQEMEELSELKGTARVEAEKTLDWVLGEAGFSGDELGKLNFQQRRRLVEELGQGELLRTKSGKVSQIDAVDAERRAELLGVVSEELTGIAFGAGMDPEGTVGYRWLELAEEAKGRAAGGGVIAPPGLYDEAGFPVSRATVKPRGRQQLEVVERAEAMVPEAERMGRGRATVGFEEHQAWLADRYADVENMAKAQIGALTDGRRGAQPLDVPVGVIKAETRKEGGLYLMDLLDEEKRVICTYSYPNYREAKVARGEAREIITAGRQGQAALVGNTATSWKAEDVMRADRRAAAAGGLVEPPTMADAAQVQMQVELEGLERIRTGMAGQVGAGVREAVDPRVRRDMLKWVKTDLSRDWSEARATAVEMARMGADKALLDYSGGRKQIDEWLGLVFPYSFWKTRSARNWALRMLERPGALASVIRYGEARERVDVERGYRSRFAGKLEVPVPGMPEWTGQAVFVDPAALMMPWAQIMGPSWVVQEKPENVMQALHGMTQKLGLRPYGFIELPLQYMNWIGKKEEIGYVLPHTGAIQAVTAATGVGPPGGVSIEAGVRRGLGLPEQEPHGAYRVMRQLSNIAGDEPGETQRALMAGELQRLVEAGDLRLGEVLDEETAGNVARLARDEGWSEDKLRAAQELLEEAMERAAMERGLTSVSSFATGVGLSMYPSGERRQVELEREQRGVMYSPLTERGGREELLEWREAHPETVVRRVARAGLPGAGEYEGWTPGAAWASGEWKKKSAEVERTYDEAVDELLAREPWNKAGARELEEERRAELDVLRDELFETPVGAPEGGEGGGVEEREYRLRSVYGAGPEEEAEIRREEVLAAVSAAMPKVSEFEDYEEYEAAVQDFFGSLSKRMEGDERLAAIAEAVGGVAGAVEGRGRGLPGLLRGPERAAGVEGLLEGVDQEAVQTYWRRNDRPLEALQRVWEEQVYGAAWEAYNAAVEGGESKRDAYESHIEGAGAVRALDLMAQVQKMYPGRWTEEELRAELEGVKFPGVGEVSTLRKPEEEQVMDRAKSAFWDFYNDALPPGRLARGAKEHTLVQLVLDRDIRGTATAEQYAQALEKLQDWEADHRTDEWGTPEEWAEARGLNDEFQALRDEALPGIQETLDSYYDLGTDERRAFKDEHPEIGEYYDLRDWFGEENPAWARYYLAEGGQSYGGRSYGGRSYGGRPSYRKRTYRRRSYGGGRGRRAPSGDEPDWKFQYQAGRVPRVFLKSPGPWDSALRAEKPYRARGTPWVFKKKGIPWR